MSPVPKPNKNESKSEFISRCISTLTKSDPNRPRDQIQAMCYTSWRESSQLDFTYSVPISIVEQPVEGNTTNEFLIKGIAINATTTDNNHKFLAEELNKAAYTLINRPLLKDHTNETDSIVGRVLTATYDENGQNIKFTARINDTEQGLKIRKLIQTGDLNTVSVGANIENMENEEGVLIPRGITFKELSIVAVPADDNAKFNFRGDFQMALKEALKLNEVTGDKTKGGGDYDKGQPQDGDKRQHTDRKELVMYKCPECKKTFSMGLEMKQHCIDMHDYTAAEAEDEVNDQQQKALGEPDLDTQNTQNSQSTKTQLKGGQKMENETVSEPSEFSKLSALLTTISSKLEVLEKKVKSDEEDEDEDEDEKKKQKRQKMKKQQDEDEEDEEDEEGTEEDSPAEDEDTTGDGKDGEDNVRHMDRKKKRSQKDSKRGDIKKSSEPEVKEVLKDETEVVSESSYSIVEMDKAFTVIPDYSTFGRVDYSKVK